MSLIIISASHLFARYWWLRRYSAMVWVVNGLNYCGRSWLIKVLSCYQLSLVEWLTLTRGSAVVLR